MGPEPLCPKTIFFLRCAESFNLDVWSEPGSIASREMLQIEALELIVCLAAVHAFYVNYFPLIVLFWNEETLILFVNDFATLGHINSK